VAAVLLSCLKLATAHTKYASPWIKPCRRRCLCVFSLLWKILFKFGITAF